jgi:flagellar biosynthesis/type III secretory pathway chaperone
MNKAELEIFSSLCEIIEESEELSLDVLGHLDIVLEKLDNLKDGSNIDNKVDNIINTVMTIMSSMQAQDFHRQKIERVANLIHPENDKFARAKNISAEETSDLVDDDELAALIAAHTS